MRGNLPQGVERADNYMKCKPSEHKPARPVVTKQEKNATDDCQYANSSNQKIIALQRPLSKVKDKTNCARENEQTSKNENWPRALHAAVLLFSYDSVNAPSNSPDLNASNG
ncbi:MAG TPA: hypothetical protein VKD70_08745 [Candidatus Acidoferrum sp.]|nr:hypothetical protein [Candidatus Acidoferrum sp.]